MESILYVILGGIAAIKLIWIAYIVLFRQDELPKDWSGASSGWGTADE